MALLAGDRIGMAAGYDVQHTFFAGHLAQRQRDGRIHIANQKINLAAVDEFACLLNTSSHVVRRVLDEQFHGAADDPAFGVDFLDRELGSLDLVLG